LRYHEIPVAIEALYAVRRAFAKIEVGGKTKDGVRMFKNPSAKRPTNYAPKNAIRQAPPAHLAS
jgi:hypothetical protein